MLNTARKNPRTYDWIKKPKILGENPMSGNAVRDLCLTQPIVGLRH